MNDDLDLRDRLGEELSNSGAPPLGSLVADSLVTARKLRWRRRFAILGSGGAVFAALAVVGLIATSNGAINSGTSQVGAPGVPGAAPKTLAPPPANPALKTNTSTGDAVYALLIQFLSPGGAVSERDVTADANAASASFVYNDGQGKATVSAGVGNQAIDLGPDGQDLACPANADGFVCESSTTPGGGKLRITTMGPYHTDCADLKCAIQDLRVELQRTDGVYVIVDAYNGPFGKGRAATRTGTLLSKEQLLAVATDPRWSLAMTS